MAKTTLIIIACLLLILIFGNVFFEFLSTVFDFIAKAFKIVATLPIFPNLKGIFGG